MSVRNLVVVLGDQLDRDSSAFAGIDRQRDLVWMAEVAEESEHVWSHKARTALFLSAMRHFAGSLADRGIPVRYLRIGSHRYYGIGDALLAEVEAHRPERLVLVRPGDYRVLAAIRETAARTRTPLELRADRHFFLDPEDFAGWAEGRRSLRLEHFYRFMRQRAGVLLEDGRPVGGSWNFDAENRLSFGRKGPGLIPAPRAFPPDAITRAVFRDVEHRFPVHPGALTGFDWPVTPGQAEQALEDFVQSRLFAFGPYQDALWTGEPYLFHSRLSAALNLKLVSPRRAVEAAVSAYQSGQAPLPSVEGFVRQILGWREFVRGIYWTRMPAYRERNDLAADRPLPAFYWSGDTDMRCLAETIGQTLRYGYAHHIQRLMVTGLFALLLGVEPLQVHGWYLAVYLDAVEWVELPNVLGMSQFADGGLLASKPYVASGRYIQRMSNYCDRCPFDPTRATGELACPFTTLYWDFLIRHEQRFRDHPRAAMQWRSLGRLGSDDRREIRARADSLKNRYCGPGS